MGLRVLDHVVAGHGMARLYLSQGRPRVQPALAGGLGAPGHIGALVRKVYESVGEPAIGRSGRSGKSSRVIDCSRPQV